MTTTITAIRNQTYKTWVTLIVWECPTCGIVYGIPDTFADALRTPPTGNADADGEPCPECGLPYGDRPDDIAPPCPYCKAADGQPSPPVAPTERAS